MSAPRRCVDCESPISPNAPNYATRCRECHKNRPAEAYVCMDCQGAIGDDAPSYANRCMQCYRSHRQSGESRSEVRGPRAAPAPKSSLASHLRRVYEPKPVPRQILKRCVECQSVLDSDVPAEVKSCFTCIGRQMCHRQCEECQAPIAMDAPLELKSCYKCIGKKAVAAKRVGGSQKSMPSSRPGAKPTLPQAEAKSASPQHEAKSESGQAGAKLKSESGQAGAKLKSEISSTKTRTKKQCPGCVQCHSPISDDAPPYANRCYECFAKQSKRQCASCQGPIPNSAPLHADQCGACKRRSVEGIKEEAKQELSQTVESTEI